MFNSIYYRIILVCVYFKGHWCVMKCKWLCNDVYNIVSIHRMLNSAQKDLSSWELEFVMGCTFNCYIHSQHTHIAYSFADYQFECIGMCLWDFDYLSDYYITRFNYHYITICFACNTSHFYPFFIKFTNWAQWALCYAVYLFYILTPKAGTIILLFKRFKHIRHEITSSE